MVNVIIVEPVEEVRDNLSSIIGNQEVLNIIDTCETNQQLINSLEHDNNVQIVIMNFALIEDSSLEERLSNQFNTNIKVFGYSTSEEENTIKLDDESNITHLIQKTMGI